MNMCLRHRNRNLKAFSVKALTGNTAGFTGHTASGAVAPTQFCHWSTTAIIDNTQQLGVAVFQETIIYKTQSGTVLACVSWSGDPCGRRSLNCTDLGDMSNYF